MKTNSLARVLATLPYMMPWIGASHYVTSTELGQSVQILEGPGPEFFNGQKPPGTRPWRTVKNPWHERLGPLYRRLLVNMEGTLIGELPEPSYGVYILSAENGDFQYANYKSAVWYIGKCEGKWTLDRAFDHFLGPNVGSKFFTTEKKKAHYAEVSRHTHRVLIVEGLGSKQAAKKLEADLLSSFKECFGELPIWNRKSESGGR